MQARIEGGEIEQLTPKLRDKILRWSVVARAEGVVVSRDAAQRAHFLRFCKDVGFPMLAVILGGFPFLVPRDAFVGVAVGYQSVPRPSGVVSRMVQSGIRSERRASSQTAQARLCWREKFLSG